jgi:hypothetical protein
LFASFGTQKWPLDSSHTFARNDASTLSRN